VKYSFKRKDEVRTMKKIKLITVLLLFCIFIIACGGQTQAELTYAVIMDQILQNMEGVDDFILESTESISFDSAEVLIINIEARHYVVGANGSDHLESVFYTEEHQGPDDPSVISWPTHSHERHFRDGYLYDDSVPFGEPLRYPIREPQNHLLLNYLEDAWVGDENNNESFSPSDIDYQITYPINSNWQVDSLFFKHNTNMIESIDGTITYVFDSAFMINEIQIEGYLHFTENADGIETASFMQTIRLIEYENVVFDFPDWIDDSNAWRDYDHWHITVDSILGSWETEDGLQSITFFDDNTGYRQLGDEIIRFSYPIEANSFLAITTEDSEEEFWEMVLWHAGYLDLRSPYLDNIRYRRDDFECEDCLTPEEFQELLDDIFGDSE